MLEKIFLLSGGYYGGGFGDLLAQWQAAGIFSYVLPFLLIFALIYGLLMKTKIFGVQKSGRAISAIIALAVGLMALQFDLVPRFFSEIFPRLGVGLAVLIVALILLGMFSPNRTWVTYTYFAIGAIILIVVLFNTAQMLGWRGSLSGIYYLPSWVMSFVLIVVVVAIIVAASRPPKGKQDTSSVLMRALTDGKDNFEG